MNRRDELVGIGLASLGALAFGTLAIFAKFAYDVGATPRPLLAVRFAIAAVLLGAFLVATGRRIWIGRAAVIRLALLGGIGYGFESSLFFEALRYAPAAVVGLVFYSYPLWTALVSFPLGLERFRPSILVALALGSGGIVLIFSVPATGVKGPLLALAAALAVTVYFVAAQVFVRGVDPTAAATWTAAGAAVSLSLVSLVTRDGFPIDALPAAGALGLATALAFAALYAAITRISSARAGIAMMLEPVTTVVLAAIFLNEALTARIGIGTALVVSALPILAGRRRADVPAADSV